MTRYFIHYPKTTYQGKEIRDITRRNRVYSDLLNDPYVFLPYTVLDGEKPETISQYYYGSVDDTWLVLYANNITDPYTEWPMDNYEFDQYFIEKYADISGKKGFDVIRWGQDQTITENVVYYYKEVEEGEPSPLFADKSAAFVDVTPEQLQEILDDKIVTINGIQYKLVKEE